MKKSKRLVSLAICMLLLVSTFAGCGSTSDSDASTAAVSSTASTTAAAGKETRNTEKIELSVAMWDIQNGFDDANAKNDTIYNDLCSKLNITIKPVQVTWNDWQDKFKIWAASNQLPDLFANSLDNGQYTTFATQGVIKALPEDLSKYPNIKAVMELPSVKPFAIDGKFYKFPRMTFASENNWANNRNIIYRKDWAKQAGFDDAPKSFEDFVAMAKAVIKTHPGSAGLSITNPGFLGTIMLGYFPEAESTFTWVKENDKWMPSFASTKFAEGMKQFRTLYTEGVLDKDFAVQKDSDGVVKFMSGKALAYLGDGVNWVSYGETFKKSNPGVKAEDAFGYMDIWPAADGNKYYFVTNPDWSETLFNANMDDKKFDRALQLLDYMYSDEWMIKVKDGIEGVDYKIENGKYISLLSADQTLAKKYPITSSIGVLSTWGGNIEQTGRLVVSSDPDKAYIDQLNVDSLKEKLATRKPAPVNFGVMNMLLPEKDKIASLGNQAQNVDMVKVILGKDDPVKMWQDVIKSYEAKGLKEAIDSVTAEAANKGIN